MKVITRSPGHLEVQAVREGEAVSVYLACGTRLVIEHSATAGDTLVMVPRGCASVTAYDANGDELANLSQPRAVADG